MEGNNYERRKQAKQTGIQMKSVMCVVARFPAGARHFSLLRMLQGVQGISCSCNCFMHPILIYRRPSQIFELYYIFKGFIGSLCVVLCTILLTVRKCVFRFLFASRPVFLLAPNKYGVLFCIVCMFSPT